MEKYEIANGKLFILDDELQINFQDVFDLPDLPDDLNSSNIYLERDAENNIKRASLMKNSLFHGQTVFFNGKDIEGKCYYFEDQLHGPSVFFSKGQILSQSWFYHGKRQGKTRRFYENGSLYCIECYKDNMLHGEQKYFYLNGQIKSFLIYENGKLQKALLYFENGKLKREIDSKRNLDRIFNET
jgi:antitoxin component YwqK of YwqJK toxin-antitoxin module